MSVSGALKPSPAVPDQEKRLLRELAKRKAEIAALPAREERTHLWTKLNNLESIRPMVWLFEVPWSEMDTDHELTLQCSTEFCRRLEQMLRRQLYRWDHMQADMIVEPFIALPPPVRDTGFGITVQADIVRSDAASSIASHHYHVQIKEEADVEKIKIPEISLDRDTWERNFCVLSEIFDGVIPVRKVGVKQTSIAPWDILVCLTGVEEVLTDMCTRPDYVHRLIDRLTQGFTHRLDRYEELNILGLNNDTYLGGGYDYTDELPPPDYDPAHVRPRDMWGRTMSQIFSSVSPAMHEEFALRYECRWLNRFGLTYYGCCEPLDKKVDILRKNVPNLRKISMSPWIDLDEAAENVRADFVFSYKPNPAVLAEDNWSPQRVRRDLSATLRRLRGMHVEIVMKDISTVRYRPERLWDWARIACEVSEQFT